MALSFAGNISKPRVVELNMTSATFEIDTIPIEAFPFRMQYAEVAENSSILTWRLLSEVVVASNYVQVFGLHPFTIYKVRTSQYMCCCCQFLHAQVRSDSPQLCHKLPVHDVLRGTFFDVSHGVPLNSTDFNANDAEKRSNIWWLPVPTLEYFFLSSFAIILFVVVSFRGAYNCLTLTVRYRHRQCRHCGSLLNLCL